MKISTTVSLFYRGRDEEFSEDKCQTRSLLLGQDNQKSSFVIRGQSQTIEAIRLHLFEKEASVNYLKIYGLTILLTSDPPGREQLLIDLHTALEFKESARMSGLTPHSRALGEIFIVDNSDPYIEVLFNEPLALDSKSCLEVELALEYLFDDKYVLARDLFLTNQENLQQETRSLKERIKVLENQHYEYMEYQGSALWKIFLCLHKCYGRFLYMKHNGFVRSFLKIFQPSWWARRRFTDYEKWRAIKGYQSRDYKGE